MMIIWTNFAKSELKAIYDYYKWCAGIVVAKKIKKEIFNTVKQLLLFPKAGTKEEYLKSIGDYRYLIKSNYKIYIHRIK